MPLDNTAKIGDIITSLEGLQAINQKAELASVIGAPATASDNVATQITKLQDAKDVFADKIGVENTVPLMQMAESLVVGKKWASGYATSSASGSTFQNITSTNNTSTASLHVVRDFGFTPTTILMISQARNTFSLYNQNLTNYGKSSATMNISSTAVVSGTAYKSDAADAYINDQGFRLPTYTGNEEYLWIAFE